MVELIRYWSTGMEYLKIDIILLSWLMNIKKSLVYVNRAVSFIMTCLPWSETVICTRFWNLEIAPIWNNLTSLVAEVQFWGFSRSLEDLALGQGIWLGLG